MPHFTTISGFYKGGIRFLKAITDYGISLFIRQ